MTVTGKYNFKLIFKDNWFYDFPAKKGRLGDWGRGR